jgi:hypothetical protein
MELALSMKPHPQEKKGSLNSSLACVRKAALSNEFVLLVDLNKPWLLETLLALPQASEACVDEDFLARRSLIHL